MKIELIEFDSGFETKYIPETTEDAAMLLRMTRTTLRAIPNIFLTFDTVINTSVFIQKQTRVFIDRNTFITNK